MGISDRKWIPERDAMRVHSCDLDGIETGQEFTGLGTVAVKDALARRIPARGGGYTLGLATVAGTITPISGLSAANRMWTAPASHRA